VKVWRRATSLGGVESLIEHRASIEGAGTPCPADLLRLSVGLEDPEDLFIDLVRALEHGPAEACPGLVPNTDLISGRTSPVATRVMTT
jgi:hypothetical protein